MVEHDIEIINAKGKKWKIQIDGATIELGKRMCKVDFANISDIECVLAAIEKELYSPNADFSSFQERINGTNLLRILDALYFDDFFQIWQDFYPQHFNPDKNYGFRYAFSLFFGFQPKEKHLPIPLFRRLKQFSESYQASSFCAIKAESKEKIAAKPHAESADYQILQLPGDNNVVSYAINNCCTVDVCLVGRPELASASIMLGYVVALEKALTLRDEAAVHNITDVLGYTATLSLVDSLFFDSARSFLLSLADAEVAQRRKVLPRTFLNNYFRRPPEYHTATRCYNQLLSELEKRIPAWNEKLIIGNQAELQSDKDYWVLYYCAPDSASVHYYSIHFNWLELNTELRAFCRAKAMAGNKKSIYTAMWNLDLALNALNDFDVCLHSIRNLTRSHVLLLLSSLQEHTDYTPKTIRYVCETLSMFYRYFAKIPNSDSRSPFYNIAVPREMVSQETITVPVSDQVTDFLKAHLREFPPVIQIGYKISLATAIRGEAFSYLTTDCLVGTTGNYCIRVCFKKTYASRVKTGRPTFQDYHITDAFAQEIQAFIQSTEELRAQLYKPYLLVFVTSAFRADSYRRPSVLSNVTLREYLNSVLESNAICDSNGVLESCSLRKIRAEIGRQLFSAGKSAEAVSTFLGNSPEIAQRHYNNSTPLDEAMLYNSLYDTIIAPTAFRQSGGSKANGVHPVLYGFCAAQQVCELPDCENCSKRIISKGDAK